MSRAAVVCGVGVAAHPLDGGGQGLGARVHQAAGGDPAGQNLGGTVERTHQAAATGFRGLGSQVDHRRVGVGRSGNGAERLGGKGRSEAEARTAPTSPIRVRFGARRFASDLIEAGVQG